MKLCRFDNDRLGVVQGGEVLDVSGALDAIAPLRWPLKPGDALIASLEAVLARAGELAPRRHRPRMRFFASTPYTAAGVGCWGCTTANSAFFEK